MVKGASSAGIKIVNRPRARADKSITRPTNLIPAALVNFEFCHILPASATKVMPIMRIDQINSSEMGSFNNSRNKPGAISKNIAERPNIIDPARKVFLTPC